MAAFENIQDYIAARSYYSAELRRAETSRSLQKVEEHRARFYGLSRKIDQLTDAELGRDAQGQATAAQAARFSGQQAEAVGS